MSKEETTQRTVLWQFFYADDVQRPSRRLRNVDTDELDFEALCDDLEEWSRKKTRGRPWFRREALRSMSKPL